MKSDLATIRTDYKKKALSRKEVLPDPVDQFNQWFSEAREAEISEVNAMFLATIKPNGRPSGRIVLLKGIYNGKFQFYTNYQSDKGKELADRPFASLTFFWKELERQVRIEGQVDKVDDRESDQYFASRPRESQIGAWASSQSHPVMDRTALEQNFEKYKDQFKEGPVPRPPHWGGYEVIADKFEFWQGRPGRLHDRISYEKSEGLSWTIKRLAP